MQIGYRLPYICFLLCYIQSIPAVFGKMTATVLQGISMGSAIRKKAAGVQTQMKLMWLKQHFSCLAAVPTPSIPSRAKHTADFTGTD